MNYVSMIVFMSTTTIMCKYYAEGVAVQGVFSDSLPAIPEVEIVMESARTTDANVKPPKQHRVYGNSLPVSNPELVVEDVNDALSRMFSRIVIWDANGDNRKRVEDTTAEPWRFIGKVGDFCAGALIGPRHVLTAAHCVWNTQTQSLWPNLDFIPALNDKEQPYGIFKWEKALFPDEFKLGSDREFDFAVIVLQNPGGDLIGSLSYGEECGQREYFVLNIGGYPTDKFPLDTMWATSCQGLRLECSERLFNHDCDTFGGMSGSPMFVFRQDIDSNVSYSIRGLHTNGVRQGENVFNQGITLTPEVIQIIDQWISQNP